MKKSTICNYTANEIRELLASGETFIDGVELTRDKLPFGEGEPVFEASLYGEFPPVLDPEPEFEDDPLDEEDDCYRGDWANDPENIAALRSHSAGADYSSKSPQSILEDIKAHAAGNPSFFDSEIQKHFPILTDDFAAALLFYCGKMERCDAVDRFEEEFLLSPRKYCDRFMAQFVKSCDFADEAEWHIAFYAEHKIQEVIPIFPPSFLRIFGEVVEDFCKLSHMEIMALRYI